MSFTCFFCIVSDRSECRVYLQDLISNTRSEALEVSQSLEPPYSDSSQIPRSQLDIHAASVPQAGQKCEILKRKGTRGAREELLHMKDELHMGEIAGVDARGVGGTFVPAEMYQGRECLKSKCFECTFTHTRTCMFSLVSSEAHRGRESMESDVY